MSDKIKKIALDVSGTSFLEDYRIKAYRGVIRYAREHTSWQLVFNNRGLSLAYRFVDYEDMLRQGVDGLIFYAQNSRAADYIKSMKIPAVDIAGAVSAHEFPCVKGDNFEIGCMGARHFLERGFRHFAFIGPSNWTWSHLRRDGFVKTIETTGHAVELFVRECEYQQGYPHNDAIDKTMPRWATPKELREWVVSLPKPVGVMACHDERALHILEACQNLGLDVPREVAILGVDDNTLICESRLPSLSSIDHNTEEIGYVAASLLDRILSGEKIEDQALTVEPKGIVLRMSTDVCAVGDPAVGNALEFIRDHLSEPIGIEDIVRVADISRRCLERRFRNQLGCTMTAEIRRRRIELAKTMLLETLLPLDKIAETSGFRRATYLTNIFTSEVGMPPCAWRRKHHRRA